MFSGIGCFGGCAFTRLINKCGVRNRSAIPWKSCSSPIGSSRGATPAPKDWCNCWSTLEKFARSLSSLFMKTRRGDAEFGRRLPENLGLYLDAVDGAYDEHCKVSYRQRRQRFWYEVRIPRAVQDVDLVATPFEGSQGEAGGHVMGVFFGLEVRDGRPVFHPASPVRCAAAKQQGLGQHGLAGAPVADERHIADLCWWVRFHPSTSSFPAGRPVGVPLHGPVQAVPVRLTFSAGRGQDRDRPLPGRSRRKRLSCECGW